MVPGRGQGNRPLGLRPVGGYRTPHWEITQVDRNIPNVLPTPQPALALS
jgi:hypothetical protein